MLRRYIIIYFTTLIKCVSLLLAKMWFSKNMIAKLDSMIMVWRYIIMYLNTLIKWVFSLLAKMWFFKNMIAKCDSKSSQIPSIVSKSMKSNENQSKTKQILEIVSKSWGTSREALRVL